jgi:RHS repeat-associated protein
MLYDLSELTYPDGNKEDFFYDVASNLTRHIDALGNEQSFTYNAYGQILTASNLLGGKSSNSYNADQTLASYTDVAGNTTNFGYDLLRRRNLITHADMTSVQMTRDGAGNLLSLNNENGHATSMTYDANGNLVTIKDPMLATTNLSYDGNDRLLTVTSPLGGISHLSYDALGRISTITDANDNETTNDYDVRNRLTSVTDPLGNNWLASYDDEGVIASRTDPLGNEIHYLTDKMGRIIKVISPLGTVERINYDALGRVDSTIDPQGRITTFSRDERGRVSEIDLAGLIRADYVRNSLGQVTSATDPNGNVWSRIYDTSGRLISSTDPLNRNKMIDYDNRNRVSRITFPSALGSLAMNYDGVGNLTGVEFRNDNDTVMLMLGYDYDANNRLTSANNGGVTPSNVTHSYDKNGRLSNSNGIVVTRDPSGRVTQLILAPGKTVKYAYDANDRLTRVSDWAGGEVSFRYDNAGRMMGLSRSNGIDTSYRWDDDSRLISIAEGTLSTLLFTRDASSRIISADRKPPLVPSSVGVSDRDASFDAASQVVGNNHDALGRLVHRGSDSFTWDGASRLVTYTLNGNTVNNSFDALGRRIRRVSADGIIDYVWNDALRLPSIAIERRSGNDFRYFLHAPSGKLLYSIDASADSRRFYHFDEMGNTLFLTDDAGSIAASYAYTPYGQLRASTGGLDNSFTWQGQNGIMNEGNGLYYIRTRFYDADMGRFLVRDPNNALGPRQLNPYQYALGNPLQYVDLDGRNVKTVPSAQNLLTQFDLNTTERETHLKYVLGTKASRENAPVSCFSEASKMLNPDFVAAGIGIGSTLGEKAFKKIGVKIVSSGVARGNFKFAGAERSIRLAQKAKVLGSSLGAAWSGFNELSQATKEGQDLPTIALRGIAASATDVAIGTAFNPAVAIVDAATGGNFSSAINQTVRIPTAILSGNRAQQAYMKAASSGDYGAVISCTHKAGEAWADRGFMGTFIALGQAYGFWLEE